MAIPTTTPTATPSPTGAAYAGAGASLQIIGQLYSAISASRMGSYNASIATYNARAQAQQQEIAAAQHDRLAQIAAYDLALSENAAAFREARIREQAAQVEGVAMARIGASGLEFSGSPLAMLDESARQAEMAVLMNQFSARLEQRSLREERAQHTYAARLARFGAQERLHVGRQQAELSQYDAGQQASVGLLRASAYAAMGGQRVQNALTGYTPATTTTARTRGTTTGTLFDLE